MRKFLLGFIIAGSLFMLGMFIYVNYVDAEPTELQSLQHWEPQSNGDVVAQFIVDGQLYEYTFTFWKQYGAPTDCREYRQDTLVRYFSTRQAIYEVRLEPRMVRVCVSYDYRLLKCKKWKVVK